MVTFMNSKIYNYNNPENVRNFFETIILEAENVWYRFENSYL